MKRLNQIQIPIKRSLTARLPMVFLIGCNDIVDFFGFAEVEGEESFKGLPCDLVWELSLILNISLKIFNSLTEDPTLPAFLESAVEDRLSCDNLSLRCNCAVDFCTRSFLADFEITGNVKRDGKRIDEDESRDKSWCLAGLLDELLIVRDAKCRSSACGFSISLRRARIVSVIFSYFARFGNALSPLGITMSNNAETTIDDIITAVAELNSKISQLREEIDEFKNENKIQLVLVRNRSRHQAIAEFNDLTKNGRRRASARVYELQRNFKGDDPPGGTDLSARLSFAKRAREVKAANEAAVFKEDYPRDDKSIADDERPNRSRGSKPSRTRTYRKSISDAEKSGRERNSARLGDVKDNGDARISSAADERSPMKISEGENGSVSGAYRDGSPANVIATSKILRRRISRGVQYDDSAGPRRYTDCLPLGCFKRESNSRKSIQEEKRKAVGRKSNILHGLRRDMNKLSRKGSFSNDGNSEKPHDTIKRKEKSMNNADLKKERFENGKEEKIGEIIDANENEERKVNANSKDFRRRMGHPGKSWLREVSAGTDRLHPSLDIADDFPDNKKKITESDLKNKRINGEYSSWNAEIVDHKVDSVDSKGNANSDGKIDVKKVMERLCSRIAKLNEIICEACAIFGGGKSATKRSG